MRLGVAYHTLTVRLSLESGVPEQCPAGRQMCHLVADAVLTVVRDNKFRLSRETA